MKKEYLDRIKRDNEWFFSDEKMSLVVTDDADSILSALMLLHYYPNKFEIGYFYDFRDGLYIKMGIDENLEKFGIDLSHPSMKCVSNHLTKKFSDDEVNINDINMNILDDNDARDYFNKYNLNTLLLVSSLCNHKFNTDVGRVVSLLPDSSYKPYFQPPSYADKGVQEKYLRILGYPDLLDTLAKFRRDRFEAGQDVLNIRSKIWVTADGIEFMDDVDLDLICKYLEIDYDPADLEGLFYLVEKHESSTETLYVKHDKSSMYSFAITRRDVVKYSYKVD